MDLGKIVKQTTEYVKKRLEGDATGHDWWHIYRVLKLAETIASKEKNVNLSIVQLGALLHDVADWKFYGEGEGVRVTKEWLHSLGTEESIINDVAHIVENVSFKGAKVENKMKSKEGLIVQDADRLDILGAIGIARVFAYGGAKGREIYNPEIKPTLHDSFEAYQKNDSSSINHFYEKLLLLKDLMNTATAKKIAEERTQYMQDYLTQFYAEWEGKK